MAESRIVLEQKKSVDPSSHKPKSTLAPLLAQAKDTAHMQAAYLDTQSLVCLSATCRGARTLFSVPPARRALYKLLRHVVHGNEKEAEAMIKNQPELLFKADTVMDYSGRTLKNVTPITAAYGADDVVMLEMMFKYLDQPNKDKAIQHINEIFPEEKESKAYDFSPLLAAITANENVEYALEQFRKDFTPGVVEKGKHFNIKNLLAAYKAYKDNWDPWTGKQASLFFRQVIGYLQRLLPACYAQAFCQGLYDVTERGNRLQRGLKLDEGEFFYPPINSHTGLGFDFGVYSYSNGAQSAGRAWIPVEAAAVHCAWRLKNHVKEKHQRFAILCNGKIIKQSMRVP